MLSPKVFQKSLIDWHLQNGRRNLPWQTGNPYHVWLSEIMLQQTQVKTVIPYFLKFISRFPTIQDLAAAQIDDVLALWAGLGYYRRAHHLHQAAIMIASEEGGRFPETFKKTILLPGIGRSTAGAILSFAFKKPYPILDANVKRVLARVFGIKDDTNKSQTTKWLWQKADELISQTEPQRYNQAIMDLGALLCSPKNPNCQACPIQGACVAFNLNLTHEIPLKSRRITVKSETLHFIFAESEGKILLERRPLTGIWSQLMCLPEEKAPEEARLIAVICHKLSHRDLTLNIYKARTEPLNTPHYHWYDTKTWKGLGLPRPIQQFLTQRYPE